MSLHVLLISVATFISGLLAAEYRTPSLYEISRYQDPILNEVFYEHHIDLRKSAGPGEPPLLPATNRPPAPQNPNFRGEVPIQRPTGFEEPIAHPTNTQVGVPDGLTELAAAGGRLAYGGAQVFARGAEQFGRAFGIQPAPQNDLFNSAARFFG